MNPEDWERLAKLASMALVKVGSEKVGSGEIYRIEFDGQKFAELLRGEAKRLLLRELSDGEG